MRILLFSAAIPLITAFVPKIHDTRIPTKLDLAVNRREAFTKGSAALAGIVGIVGVPRVSKAFNQQLDDHLTEPTQLPTGGKFDLNSAYVGDYKELRGMYPTAAGKLASNGPYKTVKDIYKIDGLSKRDLELFKKYEDKFTVNPPGRAFKERINARVST